MKVKVRLMSIGYGNEARFGNGYDFRPASGTLPFAVTQTGLVAEYRNHDQANLFIRNVSNS
jgi:hypothetical protein